MLSNAVSRGAQCRAPRRGSYDTRWPCGRRTITADALEPHSTDDAIARTAALATTLSLVRRLMSSPSLHVLAALRFLQHGLGRGESRERDAVRGAAHVVE